MKLDLSKPVQTRDGYPVEIIGTYVDEYGNRRIVGVVTKRLSKNRAAAEKLLRSWSEDGDGAGSCEWDLVNVPSPMVRRVGWMNLYRQDCGGRVRHGLFESKEEAAAFVDATTGEFMGTIPIEWEEPA